MTAHIRPAGTADLDPAADVLAGAFDSYAWTRWTIPADDYAVRLRRLQRLYLGYALDEGIVLVEDALRGVIALLPPDASAPPADMQEQVAQLHSDRLEAVVQAPVPPQPPDTWNLATLGVHPDAQGAGLGSAMLHAGLAAVGAKAVALETSDQRNVALYERAGFTVTAVTEIEGGPAVVSMLRPS
ncbi:GNAT family N-acetyltransferase [Mycolicibacterium vaccae]|uniref:GNAT family N-acetyltransferase n=1 Tax=Mycolicibacterium vaccae TaxID=1810 RepID=UPI003CEAC0BB